MRILIDENTRLFEVVASIQIMQAGLMDTVTAVMPDSVSADARGLVDSAGFPIEPLQPAVLDPPLAYAEALRDDDDDTPYPTALAKVSGWPNLPLRLPKFFDVPDVPSGIVVCPFGLKRELNLPSSVWRAVVKHLRSYSYPVYLMGAQGQRQDTASYSEQYVATDEPIPQKLALLKSAALIVGTPNEWMWAATGFKRPMITFYPDHVPPHRWFPYSDDKWARIGFEVHNIQVAIVLAGIRQLIAEL